MEKIDRLGWAAGISFDCHGARIGIRVNEPTILEQLVDYLPPGSRLSSSPMVDVLYSLHAHVQPQGSRVRRYSLLYVGAARLARTIDLDRTLEALRSNLHFSVALRARRRLFVRAGAVAWQGRAILLLGPRSSGKTALVGALVRAGATYYSHDYAVLDTHGRVHPYPTSLPLGEQDGLPSPEYSRKEPSDRARPRPLPVGLVVVCAYRSGARWRPHRLSPAQGALELLANTVTARLQPGLALLALERVLSQATILKGARGTDEPVVHALLHQNGGR